MSAMIAPPAEPASSADPKVRAEVTPDGLTVYHDSWPVEIGDDWSALLVFFGFDPAVYDVDDDTVKVSKWQQSKGTDDGGRDVIWLYSYRARFRRRAVDLEPDDTDAQVAALNRWKPRWGPAWGSPSPTPTSRATSRPGRVRADPSRA
jgi:hypothetical protein